MQNDNNTMIEATDQPDALALSSNEISGQIMAARAKADLEARMTMAVHRPRNMELVRTKMLKACQRPGFAGLAYDNVWGAAWYRLPVGRGIEGFSIRFAEEAIRNLGNIEASSTVTYDDNQTRHIEVRVTDLEANLSFPNTIVLAKTVERSYLKDGEICISQRINSNGKPVYTRLATDVELMRLQEAYISKSIRKQVLRILPGDIQVECRDIIQKIRDGNVPKNPDAQKRRIIDGFADKNITVDNLERLLGHDIGSCSPQELEMLRNLYTAIRDGHTTFWTELDQILEMREEEESESPGGKIDELKDRLKTMNQQTEKNEDNKK